MAKFDYKAARDAGWSDDQIAEFLSKKKAEGVDLYVARSDMNSYGSSGTATPPPTKTFESPTEFWDRPTQVQGPLGSVINAGKKVVATATRVGAGVGTEIGKAGLGIAELAAKGMRKANNAMGTPEKGAFWDKVVGEVQGLKKGIYEDPFKEELETIPGKIGQAGGVATVFAAPSNKINQAKSVIEGVTKTLPWIIQKAGQVAPEILGTGLTQYGTSGGDAKSAAEVGTFAGVLSALTHVSADAFRKVVPQSLKDNVVRVLGFTGKTSLKDAATPQRVDNAVGAFTTMARLAPDIKVVDRNGIEKAWDPTGSTFHEMPQVLYQVKNKVYDAYNALAQKAGTLGGNFGQKEFDDILASLDKYSKSGYTEAFSNKAAQIKRAILRFGTVAPDGKSVRFTDVSPKQIQDLVQNINKDVNLLSDAAGAEVSSQASSKIRQILDDKIESATGSEYQSVRDAYSQLKSVEKDIVDQYKKAMRRSGSFTNDFIDGIATVDGLMGLVTSNPAALARAGIIEGVKRTFQYLRDPEVNMQRVFRIIQNGSKAKTPGILKERAFGAGAQEMTAPPVKRPEILALPPGRQSAPIQVAPTGRNIEYVGKDTIAGRSVPSKPPRPTPVKKYKAPTVKKKKAPEYDAYEEEAVIPFGRRPKKKITGPVIR